MADSDEVDCGTDSTDSTSYPEDTDSDGTCNSLDTDDDNDGWSDIDEILCGTNTTDFESYPTDTDSDGICDVEDLDDDGDGYNDTIDQFPLTPTEWIDTDNDGLGDNSDLTMMEMVGMTRSRIIV